MNDQTGFDPKRRLCPDGTCTGIIGGDGRCGECGRAVGGGKSAGNSAAGISDANGSLTDEGASGGSADADVDVDESPLTAAPDGTGSSFDPNRRLCSDGACVGIVGPHGTCTACGRVAG